MHSLSEQLKKHIKQLSPDTKLLEIPSSSLPVSLFQAMVNKDHCRINNIMKAAEEGQIVRII